MMVTARPKWLTIRAMKRLKIPIFRWLAISILLFAAACAAPTGNVPTAAFSNLQAEKVFTVGLGNISEKYIDPHTAGELALDGLKGFTSIDPNLTITDKGGRVILASAAGPIAVYPRPANDNVKGWAALMVKASVAGRLASAEMGEADGEKLYQATFDAILGNLDRFSRYAGAMAARKNRARRDGFGGIGIRFRVMADGVRVIFIMPETPAARAGLKKGDVITTVNGKALGALSADAAGKLLRGPEGSRVLLNVLRKGASARLSFDFKRAHIISPTVTYAFDKGIGTLKITRFNRQTARGAARMLKKAVTDKGRALKGIIVDLRGNPGGLLRQSIKVADLFLTRGRIIDTRGRSPESIQHYDAGGRDVAQGRPLAILMDGESASASEIVAAALQDRGRAIIIGTSSFGKGTIQTVIRLPNNGEIALTWSRMVTPSGYILHGLGVPPTVCTSGLEIQPPGAMSKMLKRRFLSTADLKIWRNSRFEDKAGRRKLRALCPAERRRTLLDAEVAKRLMADKTLYARAINLTAPATKAHE